jgi:hypothetical protein
LLIVERRQRRFRIHRPDQPIKAEHLSLSLKETYLRGPIKRGAPPQQLRSAFWPGPGRAKRQRRSHMAMKQLRSLRRSHNADASALEGS